MSHNIECLLDLAQAHLDVIGFSDDVSMFRKSNGNNSFIKVLAPFDLIRSELSDEYVVIANSRNTCTVTVRA